MIMKSRKQSQKTINMKKRRILFSILIVSTLIGIFSLIKAYNLMRDFKESFNQFATPVELRLDLDKGVYDLYELSTKTDTEDELDIDYLVSVTGENPKVIEIEEDKFDIASHKGIRMTYVVNKNKFKSFGQFEIDEKQAVIIRSGIKDSRINKLALRSNEKSQSFFDVMSYSLLLLLSVGGILVSGISLLVIRRRQKINC